MNAQHLASKKNVILLAIIAALIVYFVVSYAVKHARLEKQEKLGGQVELFSSNVAITPQEFGFMRGNSVRFSHVADIRTPFSLSKGIFESQVRVMDNTYPLRGKMQLDRKQFKLIFPFDRESKSFGVAVNQVFLDQAGLKFGDGFVMNNIRYQVRGLIEKLPDEAGQAMLNAGPLLLIKHDTMRGSGMMKNATKRDFRYRILPKKMDSAQFEKRFRQTFPKSTVAIRQWDA